MIYVTEKAKKKKRKSKVKTVFTKAKKKTAVARAVIKKGKGTVFINKRSLSLIQPKELQDFVSEPLELAGPDFVSDVDISVKVAGGGFMGQAVAARAAIAKALASYSNDKKLKDAFLRYDRMLLVDDPRRKEKKKPLGVGARRKKQSSKR